MVWVEAKNFLGWACSACAWQFHPSHIPTGNTLAEIKLQYEQERDKAFESHACPGRPKP